MILNLLPSINKNKDFKIYNEQKDHDYSIIYKGKAKSIKKDLFDSYQKAISYKYISPSIKSKILNINNKNNQNNQNFNLTLTKELIDNRHDSKYLLTDTINNNKLKNNYKELNKTFNRKIKNISIYNNSYSKDPFENLDKKSKLYKDSRPSLKSTSSSKKNYKPINIEQYKNKNGKLFVKKSFNLMNFSKKMKNLNNNSENNSLFKPNLALSNKYMAIPSPKKRSKDKNDKNDNKNKLIKKKESIKIEKETEKNAKILSLTTDDFNPINKGKAKLQKELLKKKKNIFKELLKDKKYRKILDNPDLKVLYNINRKKMIKMIKSQSKTNKLKLSLKEYQNNLIRKYPKLKSDTLRTTLNRGFQYLQFQNKATEPKSRSLVKYINNIQNMELDVINESNNFNQNLYSKFIELGFSPRKYNIKAEKIEYKDVLTNYK